MKKRIPKKTDQDEIEKAMILISKTAEKHPEIESTLWSAALISLFSMSYKEAGGTFEEFAQEVDHMKEHYKKLF